MGKSKNDKNTKELIKTNLPNSSSISTAITAIGVTSSCGSLVPLSIENVKLKKKRDDLLKELQNIRLNDENKPKFNFTFFGKEKGSKDPKEIQESFFNKKKDLEKLRYLENERRYKENELSNKLKEYDAAYIKVSDELNLCKNSHIDLEKKFNECTNAYIKMQTENNPTLKK